MWCHLFYSECEFQNLLSEWSKFMNRQSEASIQLWLKKVSYLGFDFVWGFLALCKGVPYNGVSLNTSLLSDLWCDKISASYLLTSMWCQKALSSISRIDSNWYLVYTSFVIFKSQKQLNCTLSQRWIVFRGRFISSNTQNFSNASLE